jgi:hypothetical protein
MVRILYRKDHKAGILSELMKSPFYFLPEARYSAAIISIKIAFK